LPAAILFIGSFLFGQHVTPKIQDSADLRRKQLVVALASPIQYTGLRLTARLLQSSSDQPSTSSTGKRPTEFMLGVMGNSITIDREKGSAIDSNRKRVVTRSQAIATGLKPEMMQKTLQTGLGIPEKVDLVPGKYEVKFAVRDNFSRLVGTVSVPIELTPKLK
jgi:hypothetical protein